MGGEKDLSETVHNVKASYNVWIPMRDGVKLSADIYHPEREGRYPVLLMRTYYGKCQSDLTSKNRDFINFFVERGYVVVIQDCRGRWDSEGEFYPVFPDFEDGYDTIEWCGTQEWSNGNVGMFGCSFPGCIQWPAAISGNKHLKCIVPRDSTSEDFLNGGFMRMGIVQGWLDWCIATAGRTTRRPLKDSINWFETFKKLPLIELDERLGFNIPWWKDYFRHPSYDEYWERMSYERKHSLVSVPSLNVGGWYSNNDIDGTIRNFKGVTERGKELPQGAHRLLIGPWPHCKATSSFFELDFGEESMIDLNRTYLKFYEHWLKGKKSDIMEEPPIKYFLMGANKWCRATKWPPKDIHYEKYYFHSGGSANSLHGDGTLNLERPKHEGPDKFTYDPENPVPFPRKIELEWTSLDQKDLELRDDVLVYTSPPLEEDLNIVGNVRAKIWASSSALDTDFVAKLVDVNPNDSAIYVTAGIIRARFRSSFERPSLIEPGKIYEYDIDMGNTAIRIKKTHNIRLEVTSSAFPNFLKNQNTGKDPGTDIASVEAEQTIYHNREFPSCLELPILEKPAQCN